MKKIHMMGIGGSGISAIAFLAVKEGYEVSGCDLQESTAYSEKLKKLGIKTYMGHSEDHIDKSVDALIVTPAVYFTNKNHPEVKKAQELEIPVMTGQEFMGKVLLKGKNVIAISGTHGKSTTTALTSLIFEKANLDPSVFIGATVKEWNSNSREGKSKYFIVEADEFYDNFLNYNPETLIINNIEFDHPDFFKNFDQILESFAKLVNNLVGRKFLVFNQDSEGIEKLFEKLGDKKLEGLNLVGYTLGKKKIEIENSIVGEIVSQAPEVTKFKVTYPDGENENYNLKIPGEHNVSNALGVIAVSKLYEIDKNNIDKVFNNFEGVGRRLDLIGEKNGIKVYDDYGHHPTALRATIDSLRQKYPNSKITAVIEAHSFSRTKALLSQYKGVFDKADKIIVGPIFKARDNNDFGVSGQSIINASEHKNGVYLDSIDKISSLLKSQSKSGDIILVMGAGESYKWARDILKGLN